MSYSETKSQGSGVTQHYMMGLLDAPEKSLWPLKQTSDLAPCFFLFDLFTLKLCNSIGNEFLASQS